MYPGDIIVGDADGVVVLPAGIADEIAEQAGEQERFVLERVARGAPLLGTYPPNAKMQAAYAAWRARQG